MFILCRCSRIYMRRLHVRTLVPVQPEAHACLAASARFGIR